MTDSRGQRGRAWCSLRLRFDARELILLHGAENVRGTALAHQPRPEVLRDALTLAKAGQKIEHAGPGASIVLDQGETTLLLEAARFAVKEIQWAASRAADSAPARRQAVLDAFPELQQQGLWRSFGVVRDLEALAERLRGALTS